MKKFLFILWFFIFAVNTFAAEIKIGDLWYNLVPETKEAIVIANQNFDYYTGSVVIPQTIEYETVIYDVASIGGGAFAYCSGLTSIEIPNTVTNIGDGAFICCRGLNTIVIPNSVSSIGQYAFYECTGLSSVTMPSNLKNICEEVFAYCTSLTSVHISDIAAWCSLSFTYYSNPLLYAHHLFLNGEEVKDLVIPDNVTTALLLYQSPMM